LDTRFDLAVTA